MKTLNFRWQLTLLVATLVMAIVLPTEAARYRRVAVARTAAVRTAVFQVASTAKIAVGVNRSATLLDLKIGDHVSIAYDQENGALVAHHISDGVPHKPHNPSVTPAPSVHHAQKASVVYEHIHGIVQSVDVQAGTLTFTYKPK